MKKSLCHKLPTLILLICVTLLGASHISHYKPSSQYKKSSNIHVVFDLGGVLMKTSTSKAVSKLGKWNMLKYAMRTGQNPRDIKKRLYDILNAIQPKGNNCGACDPHGDKMPGLMCDWQTGRKSTAEILTIIEPVITSSDLSEIEKKVFCNLTNIIFTPQELVETQEIIKSGLACVKACKEKGYIVHVLSNWDAESFDLLYQKYPQLFELFDHDNIFVSGFAGCMKPEKKFFTLVKKCDPSAEFIMIDDQPENIKSAEQCGMHGILCLQKKGYFGMNQKPDFDSVYEELEHITEQLNSTSITCTELI